MLGVPFIAAFLSPYSAFLFPSSHHQAIALGLFLFHTLSLSCFDVSLVARRKSISLIFYRAPRFHLPPSSRFIFPCCFANPSFSFSPIDRHHQCSPPFPALSSTHPLASRFLNKQTTWSSSSLATCPTTSTYKACQA